MLLLCMYTFITGRESSQIHSEEEEVVATTTESPSKPAKVSVTTVSDGDSGPHAPSTAGSYAFFLGSITWIHFIAFYCCYFI